MRSTEELNQKAAELEKLLDADDDVKFESAADLRAVAEAADAVAAAQARLTEAVELAHAHGRSWGRIGIALGVSRQAARQRYGHPALT